MMVIKYFVSADQMVLHCLVNHSAMTYQSQKQFGKKYKFYITKRLYHSRYEMISYDIHDVHTLLEKRLLHLRNEVTFWRLFIFYLLLRSQGRLVGRIYAFQCIVCTILFDVYFGKSVRRFIDIGEIGCMDTPKCNWMVIVVNLVKQTWLFAWCSQLV